jgi:hypothetical protein
MSRLLGYFEPQLANKCECIAIRRVVDGLIRNGRNIGAARHRAEARKTTVKARIKYTHLVCRTPKEASDA